MRILLTFLMLYWPAAAHAAGRERFVRQETAITVVPFAVPVATPVAVVNPTGVFYAYSPLAATYGAAGGGAASELSREFEEFRRWKESKQAARPAAESMVANRCSKCHSGAAAKGDFRLDGPLSADARLAAIRAVLAGRMPKDQPLSPDETGALVKELAQDR